MSDTPRSIAIVGSGPAGCYLAQALRRSAPDADLVIIEQLPVPYGLLRYGVAADHQGTKAVSRQFDRLFDREGVEFLGNVTVGVDIPLDVLREQFDAVVLSTGLTDDVPLSVPGAHLPGVIGAGRITRALNSHPSTDTDGLGAGARALVVGAGNVAIDIVRLLAKAPGAFEGSDVDDALRDGISEDLVRIEVIGRSSAGLAKFDIAMLRELGELEGVAFEFHEAPSPPTGDEQAFVEEDPEEAFAKRHLLAELASKVVGDPRLTVAFRFGLVPLEIFGEDRVRGVRLGTSDGLGGHFDLEVDSVFSAVGFRQSADEPLRRDALVGPTAFPEEGRLDDGLYCVGWLRTGPRGTIPTHRAEAKRIAEMIAADLAAMDAPRAPGLGALRSVIRSPLVEWSGWRKIDEHERAHAAAGRVRAKLRSIDEMLNIASHGGQALTHS